MNTNQLKSGEQLQMSFMFEKECQKCGERKPKSAKYFSRTGRGGLRNTCKRCYQDAQNERRKKTGRNS